MSLAKIIDRAASGARLSSDRGSGACRCATISAPLMRAAAELRDRGHGDLVSYSRKVFIPLTQLCRDVCHYCTFAHPPRHGEAAYLDRRAGAGDRPRRRRGRLQGGAVHARRQAGAALRRGARGARPARPRDDAVLSRRDGGAGAEGNRPAAAPQSRRDDPRGDRAAARRLGVAGHHARERRRAAVASRRAAFRLARQGACGAARGDRGGRRGGGAVHLGHPDRHRRDPPRAHRGVARAARPARAPRPHPGNHHPEFPRQARHPHGGRARARSRRASVDDCGGAADLRAGDEPPGAAQSDAGRAGGDDRGRDQRLGRRLAGHAGPRQPRGAVAASRRPRPPHRRGRQIAGRAARDLSGLCAGPGALARCRSCAPRCCA